VWKYVLQCVVVCCSVCGVLQCVAVCIMLQFTALIHTDGMCGNMYCSVLQCVAVCAVCCSVLHYLAVYCVDTHGWYVWKYVLQRVAVCCGVLQCVAVCCSVLQCVAVCCVDTHRWYL